VSCPVGFVLLVGHYIYYRKTFSLWSPRICFHEVGFLCRTLAAQECLAFHSIPAASNAIVVVAFRVSSRDFLNCNCIRKIIAHTVYTSIVDSINELRHADFRKSLFRRSPGLHNGDIDTWRRLGIAAIVSLEACCDTSKKPAN
jgi:hypothetical protein